jgi:hypothetical protein
VDKKGDSALNFEVSKWWLHLFHRHILGIYPMPSAVLGHEENTKEIEMILVFKAHSVP